MNAERLLYVAISLVCCAVNYYIGKARGAAEERDRWTGRVRDYD